MEATWCHRRSKACLLPEIRLRGHINGQAFAQDNFGRAQSYFGVAERGEAEGLRLGMDVFLRIVVSVSIIMIEEVLNGKRLK